MRPSMILTIGLSAGLLAGASLMSPASAQGVVTSPDGVMETSPTGSAVRTYSNGVRVPVPQNPPSADEQIDPDRTGSIQRRVPNPHTTINPLGCPEIDPLCQGRPAR